MQKEAIFTLAIRRILMAVLGIGLTLTLTSTGFSETYEDGAEIYTLGEIVVTAETEGIESVATVREITAKEIQARGARTLDEALELLPGVRIRTGANGTPRVDLRGFRSRHAVLLLDGIPFNSTFDGQFDPSLIPVESIAKIKVSYGNHSVLYGDGGLGGVINIITKKGAERIHGSVSQELGTDSHYLGRFTLSGGSGKADFFLGGSIYDRSGFPLSDDFNSISEEDGSTRENSDKERENLFANIGYSPNDEWQFGAVLNYVSGEYGVPPSTIDDKDDPFANRPKYERVDDLEGVSGHLSAAYVPCDQFRLRSWVFFNQMDEEVNRYDDENYDSMDRRNSSSFDNTTTIVGGALQPRYDFGSAGLITVGLNARQEEYESDGRVNNGSEFETVKSDDDIEVYSASVEYEISPIDRLMLVLGYGHSWFENDEGSDDDDYSLLIGTYYDLSDETRLRGSAARQIRFPTIRNLFDEDAGNPDLTTEISYNYEIGLDQVLPYKSNASATIFYIDVKDYIEKMPLPDETEMFLNNDNYEFYGFELSAETRYIENLVLRSGYTYMESEDKSSDAERDELQNRAVHKLTFEAQYLFPFGLTAYASVNRIADQVFYSKESPLIKKKGDDFTLVDFKLDQALFDGLLHVFVGVNNLFDEDYEESYGYPQEGRFVYAGGKIVF